MRRLVSWEQVRGKLTRISLMGSELEGDVPRILASSSGLIILMVPGNPGNEKFYSHFGMAVLKKIFTVTPLYNEHAIFCTVSHLNHVPIPHGFSSGCTYSCSDRYTLADQIQHKLDFCLQYLTSKVKIILVGHSIGSYVILRILPDLLKQGFNIVRCIALFPTIENMADSPNGRLYSPWIEKLCEWDSVIKSLFFWLSSMPNFVKKYICAWCMKSDEKVPQCILESSAELVDINVIRNIVFMAKDELHTVATLDEALLHHSDRCRFLYGTSDLWCPLHYASEMQRRIGRGLVFIDDKCDHAFVVRHGEAVADKIAAWITEC